MRYKIATTCFVIASVLAPAAAYAADGDSDRSRPGTFVKDGALVNNEGGLKNWANIING